MDDAAGSNRWSARCYAPPFAFLPFRPVSPDADVHRSSTSNFKSVRILFVQKLPERAPVPRLYQEISRVQMAGDSQIKLLILFCFWWAHKGSNLGHLPCEASAGR